jgi:molybdenum cofactor cytidylyltransferase
MKLSQALNIQPGDIVALVGAGGKTTSLFSLARELTGLGWQVITTTTTRIGQNELQQAPAHLGIDERDGLPPQLAGLLAQHHQVFLYRSLLDTGKVKGLPLDWFADHLVPPPCEAVLIEADGARRLPLKAPYDHEPAIPDAATKVLVVGGLDSLDTPLDPSFVYGADRVQALIGCAPGEPVNEELLAAILRHPAMGLKSAPDGASVSVLLNKVTSENLPRARIAAAHILKNRRISQVLIGAVAEENPIREARRRVAAVILAAGQSSRMGQAKLLLPWGKSTIIRTVCQQVAACGLDEILVVTGSRAEAIAAEVEGLPVRVIYNPQYEAGEMLSSLKTGITAIGSQIDACLVVLGDQPAVTADICQQILAAYAEGHGLIIAPAYQGQRGHPVLFDRAYWPALQALPVDSAPRDVLREKPGQVFIVQVDTPGILLDIDTPEDYDHAQSG